MPTRLQTRTAAAVAVARGAALLDHKFPDWWKQIDLDKLHLNSDTECVLGQLFEGEHRVPRYRFWGYDKLKDAMADRPQISRAYLTQRICMANYAAGTVLLGLNHEATIKHGFNSGTVTDDGAEAFLSYATLDNAWWTLIDTRQQAAKVS